MLRSNITDHKRKIRKDSTFAVQSTDSKPNDKAYHCQNWLKWLKGQCIQTQRYSTFFQSGWNTLSWFPTCQVRVVRFYQSCSPHPPPPRPPPSPPPPSSSSSASSSSSTTSASTSTSTVALPSLGQALRQLRSSVRTAGPQPGTFPAQCAPLDLNLGPS